MALQSARGFAASADFDSSSFALRRSSTSPGAPAADDDCATDSSVVSTDAFGANTTTRYASHDSASAWLPPSGAISAIFRFSSCPRRSRGALSWVRSADAELRAAQGQVSAVDKPHAIGITANATRTTTGCPAQTPWAFGIRNAPIGITRHARDQCPRYAGESARSAERADRETKEPHQG